MSVEARDRPGIVRTAFGRLPDGREASLFELRDGEMTVRIGDYGGVVQSIRVPERDGRIGDVVLGYDSVDGYLAGTAYLGAIIGRYANRIARGRFALVRGQTRGYSVKAGTTNVEPEATCLYSEKIEAFHERSVVSLRYGPWGNPKTTSPFSPDEPVFVSGFGAVSIADRTGRMSGTRMVQVRRTAFRQDFPLDTAGPIVNRLDPSRYDWFDIPVSLLPAMHVGQLWRGETLLQSPAYEYEEFSDILVVNKTSDREWRRDYTCELVWDFQSVLSPHGSRGGPPLVPLAALRVTPPARQGFTWDNRSRKPGIRCLRLALLGTTDTLVIPCMEIVRFYYAPSSVMADAVFSGFGSSETETTSEPRHLDQVYNLSESLVVDGVPRIQLRKLHTNGDVQLAARLRCDPAARRRALSIGTRLAALELNRRVPVVEAQFPFEGQTTLGVRGMWMESEAAGVRSRAFYVFKIEKSVDAWPFSEVHRDRDNRHNEGKANGDADGGDEERVQHPGTPSPRQHRGEVIHPEEPSIWTALRKIIIPPPNWGPEGGIRVVDVSDSDRRASGWGRPGVEPSTEGVSTVQGGHGASRRARAGVVREEKPEEQTDSDESASPVRLQVDIEIFREALREITSRRRWALEWRNPFPGGSGADPAFPLEAPGARRPAWAYIDRDSGRRRHVAIADVLADGRHVYLFECERRASETMSTLVSVAPGGGRLEDATLAGMLKICVERGKGGKGIWGSASPGAFHRTLHHPHRLTEGATEDERREFATAWWKLLEGEIRSACAAFRIPLAATFESPQKRAPVEF